MLRHKYNYVSPEGEVNNDRSLVQLVGVRSNKERIQDMLLAGFRLEVSRQQFDSSLFENGIIPEDYFDQTREPGFDMADAHRLIEEIRERLKSPAIKKHREEVTQHDIPEDERDINKDGKISEGKLPKGKAVVPEEPQT